VVNPFRQEDVKNSTGFVVQNSWDQICVSDIYRVIEWYSTCGRLRDLWIVLSITARTEAGKGGHSVVRIVRRTCGGVFSIKRSAGRMRS
jgi:hypothetical protein